MGEPFDVDRLVALPRLGGLAVSPDGSRLVTSVATVARDGKKYTTALWEVDPAGGRPPRRLTRSAPGESLAAFLPDGSLLFTSTRQDPDAPPPKEGEEVTGLWLLPAAGGEAVPLAAPPGGIAGVAVARQSGTVAALVPAFPGSADWEDDRRRGDERREKGIGATLHDDIPVRWWDHYLGPRFPRIAVGTPAGQGSAITLALRDLTPDAGTALVECSLDITPDGSTVVTGWRHGALWLQRLVAVDVATGNRRTLAEGPDLDIGSPACSPDGRSVAVVADRSGSPDRPRRVTVWVVDLASGVRRNVLAGADIWPDAIAWTPDSAALLVGSDEGGKRPVWRLEVEGDQAGRLRRLTAGLTCEQVVAIPGGRLAAALASTPVEPHHVVVLDTEECDQEARPLPDPSQRPDLGTRLEELWVDSPDGRARVQSWLFLPAQAAASKPAPLVLFIHGGPFASWRGWVWRWNASVLADHGYAVLAVNPALSTGLGWENVDRSWHAWGEVVEADLLAAVEAACARDDVDGTRVAAAGGSFGGYMANWLAGRSDRFRCLVTHASVWALDQFHGTTDVGVWLEEEFGNPYETRDLWERNDPRRNLARLAVHRTPMLVIHGDLDARVPVGEALRLFTDLRRLQVPARLLRFPDENHWILRPNNIRTWYATVLAFLDEHLRGLPFARPELL